MTSRLGSENELWPCNDASGLLQNSASSNHATTTIVTSYNPDDEGGFVGLDGIADKIILPIGVFDATADVSGYIAMRYKDSVGANKQFWTMDPNAGAPTVQWFGASGKTWDLDINNSGGTRAKFVADDPLATEILVFAFSYKVSTRLMSLVLESSLGTSLTATATETVTLPTNRAVKIGANGPNSVFTAMDVFQIGTYTTQYGVGDLTDTAAALLAEIIAASNGGPTTEQKQRGIYLFDGPALSN